MYEQEIENEINSIKLYAEFIKFENWDNIIRCWDNDDRKQLFRWFVKKQQEVRGKIRNIYLKDFLSINECSKK